LNRLLLEPRKVNPGGDQFAEGVAIQDLAEMLERVLL